MARLLHSHPLARLSLPLAIAAALLCSLAPLRWLGWAEWFSEQVTLVVAPISHPIKSGVDLVFPQPTAALENASEREQILAAELERVRVRLLQAEQRSIELEGLVEQLSRGALLHPDVEVTQLPRPIFGEVGDLLQLRAGSIDGVHRFAVVTTQSVQIVGRVSDVDARTARVLPITAKSAPKLSGVVILDDETGRRAACLLEPAGNGTLVGDVSPPEDGRADEIQVGQTVRLLDEQWPRHAQMLVIGDIERVEPSVDQPLRRRITVKPRTNLRRVSEVIVRLPAQPGTPAGGTSP
jgi:cell shape-determining protein MreC